MRTVAMDEIIKKSFKRTISILFKPFSLKKWLLLLLIAWLAGELGGGGGSNFGNYVPDSKKSEAAQERSVVDKYSGLRPQASADKAQDILNTSFAGSTCPFAARDDASSGWKWVAVVFIIAGVAVLLLLVILFTWLTARFKFIWLDAVIKNDASVVEPFGRYGKEANSLFKLFLLLYGAIIVFCGILFLWLYANGFIQGVLGPGADWTFMQGLRACILPALMLVGGIIVLVVFGVCIDHFTLPIMSIERCSFLAAWRKLVPIIRANMKEFFLYLLLLVGLGILSGLIAVIAALAVIVVLLVAAAVLFGLPYLLIVTLLKAKILYIVFAVIAGIPFIAVAVLLLVSVNLPLAVFFRCFSLYFLSSIDCGYTPLPLTEPPQTA